MLELTIHQAETTIPQFVTWLNGGKVMAFGHGQCILGGQKGHGDLGFYATFKTAESWFASNGLDYGNNVQMLDWFKQEFRAWSPFWYALFAHAAIPFIPRPVYYMPPDQSWEPLPNVTMIGDAAHVMSPFAGEGANMAMLDALELSVYLNDHADLRTAIALYENGMRKRASAAIVQSLQNGDRMHSAIALKSMLALFHA